MIVEGGVFAEQAELFGKSNFDDTPFDVPDICLYEDKKGGKKCFPCKV